MQKQFPLHLSIFKPAEKDTSLNLSGFEPMISIVCIPMEPVAPSKLIFFVIYDTLSVILQSVENEAMAIQKGDYRIYLESHHGPAVVFLNPSLHNAFLVPIRQDRPVVRQSMQ